MRLNRFGLFLILVFFLASAFLSAGSPTADQFSLYEKTTSSAVSYATLDQLPCPSLSEVLSDEQLHSLVSEWLDSGGSERNPECFLPVMENNKFLGGFVLWPEVVKIGSAVSGITVYPPKLFSAEGSNMLFDADTDLMQVTDIETTHDDDKFNYDTTKYVLVPDGFTLMLFNVSAADGCTGAAYEYKLKFPGYYGFRMVSSSNAKIGSYWMIPDDPAGRCSYGSWMYTLVPTSILGGDYFVLSSNEHALYSSRLLAWSSR